MPKNIDTQWFVDRLDERRLSQRGLAKLLGLDSSAVSLMFRGKRDMKLTEAAQIAQLIGAPVDEVLHHAGVHEISRGARASVYGLLDSSGEIHAPTSQIEIDAPPGLPAGCVAIQSRAGDHTDGWLYFLEMPTGIAADAVGRFCCVKIRNGVRTLAVVSRSYMPRRYAIAGTLSSDAADLEYAEPILLIQP